MFNEEQPHEKAYAKFCEHDAELTKAGLDPHSVSVQCREDFPIEILSRCWLAGSVILCQFRINRLLRGDLKILPIILFL
jgi:hypothetical protein